MNPDALKLTTYFGERDRAGGRFLADALIDLYARRETRASVLLRGIEGFGLTHHLQTDRLLSLSEDLPVVSVAVDTRERIEAALPDVGELHGHGLITLERARLWTRSADAPPVPGRSAKLTVYLGRRQRLRDAPAHVAVTAIMHEAGVAGATTLMGVDGTAHGLRRRGRFAGRNPDVPLMVIAVGDSERIDVAAELLGAALPNPLMTVERVQVCKRDGELLARPRVLDAADASGLALWQKLMVYAGEQARHDGRPLYPQIVNELRGAGARGATVVRGIWGYHGDHEPHGDRLLSLRRHVPVVTIVVDTPDRARGWFEVIDDLTDETGLVTSELVPALRARAPGAGHGGLLLADDLVDPDGG